MILIRKKIVRMFLQTCRDNYVVGIAFVGAAANRNESAMFPANIS